MIQNFLKSSFICPIKPKNDCSPRLVSILPCSFKEHETKMVFIVSPELVQHRTIVDSKHERIRLLSDLLSLEPAIAKEIVETSDDMLLSLIERKTFVAFQVKYFDINSHSKKKFIHSPDLKSKKYHF